MSDAPAELGGYRVEQELGEGGMARVYRAYDPRFDRYVALKILKPSELADPTVVARFLDEARNAGPLSHPNIVRVHRVEAQPQPFIDMELVEGPTLGVWLADHGGRMPWQEAVRIACDLASALEHAHRLGRVHRDVKPGNILMADEGRTPKLVDFGIAMIDRPEATRLTRHGEMVGTPRYMSPEQVRGEQVDARTDLYSLGAVLYEILVGGPAVDGDSLVAVTTRIVTGAPRPLRERMPSVPAALAAVVERLMAKDRAARYATAADARAALEACMGRRDRPAPEPAWPGQGNSGVGSGGGRRLRLPLVIGGVAGLAVLGTLLWLLLVTPESPITGAPVAHPPIVTARPGDEPPPFIPDVATPTVPAVVPAPSDAHEAIVRLDEELRAMPCARLETEPVGSGLGLQVASTDPTALATADSRLGSDVAAARLRGILLPEGAVACNVFDLINRFTPSASPRFMRLEAPIDGVCDVADRARCYTGLADGRLAEGERLVLAVDPPPGKGHVLVDYFMIDGNVAHIYPPRGPDETKIPAATYAGDLAGTRVVIGDSRAGAADVNEYPVQPPFGHELVLAIASAEPLFDSTRPFVEPSDTYLSSLNAAFAGQREPIAASTLWLETVSRHP